MSAEVYLREMPSGQFSAWNSRSVSAWGMFDIIIFKYADREDDAEN